MSDPTQPDQTLVETADGPLLVLVQEGLVRARGIGYANATRFAAPTAIQPTTEVRDATHSGAACPQLPSRLDHVMGSVLTGLATSETQCLVLSVTAPATAAATATGVPVMVWFHGGAYMSGSGEAEKYDPAALVSEGNVVVVNVSYRLGIFGYAPPQVSGGTDDETTHNLGLRDQLLALRWVSRNIRAFGGDPHNVTLFGQSAGGDSVLSLMLCEDAQGRFRRAIVQSAPIGLRTHRGVMHRAIVAAVSEKVGDVALTGTAEEILQAQTAALSAAEPFGALGSFPFGPVYGAGPLPDEDDEANRRAKVARHVDLIVTHTTDDALPFALLAPHGAALSRHRLGRALLRVAARKVTQRLFARPATELVTQWTQVGGRGRHYVFTWRPTGTHLGACHCIELPLLFGSPKCWTDANMIDCNSSNIDQEVARRIRGAWAAFAYDGTFPASTRHLRRLA